MAIYDKHLVTLCLDSKRTSFATEIELVTEPEPTEGLAPSEPTTLEFEMTIPADNLFALLGPQEPDPRTERDLEGSWLW